MTLYVHTLNVHTLTRRALIWHNPASAMRRIFDPCGADAMIRIMDVQLICIALSVMHGGFAGFVQDALPGAQVLLKTSPQT